MASIHTPLDVTSRQFRLVRVLKSTFEPNETNVIACELAVFDLDSMPTPIYNALSYCWTKAEATCKISLNESVWFVRPHLHSFLMQLFREQDDHWIFIDALCIDQSSITEKSRQVALMGDVYRNAVDVYAWVGGYEDAPGREMDSYMSSDSWEAFLGNKRAFALELCKELDLNSVSERRGTYSLGTYKPVCTTEKDLDSLWRQICSFGRHIVTRPDAATVQAHILDAARAVKKDMSSMSWTARQMSYKNAEHGLIAAKRALQVSLAFGEDCELPSWRIFQMLYWLLDARCDIIEGLIRTICCSEYWMRLWVVQEMVLAHNLILKYGDVAIDWRALLFFLHVRIALLYGDFFLGQLSSPEDWSDARDGNIDATRDVRQFFCSPLQNALADEYGRAQDRLCRRETVGYKDGTMYHKLLAAVVLHQKRFLQQVAQNSKLPLAVSLAAFGQQQCSIAHDKIFGLLGLSASEISVDYEMSLAELGMRAILEAFDLFITTDLDRSVGHMIWSATLNISSTLRDTLGPSTAAMITSRVTGIDLHRIACIMEQHRRRRSGRSSGSYSLREINIFRRMARRADRLILCEPGNHVFLGIGLRMDRFTGLSLAKMSLKFGYSFSDLLSAYRVQLWLWLCKVIDASPSLERKGERSSTEVVKYSEWMRFFEDMCREYHESRNMINV